MSCDKTLDEACLNKLTCDQFKLQSCFYSKFKDILCHVLVESIHRICNETFELGLSSDEVNEAISRIHSLGSPRIGFQWFRCVTEPTNEVVKL